MYRGKRCRGESVLCVWVGEIGNGEKLRRALCSSTSWGVIFFFFFFFFGAEEQNESFVFVFVETEPLLKKNKKGPLLRTNLMGLIATFVHWFFWVNFCTLI